MDARLGFHPSYGYAFQLFTYTETIIIIEGFLGVGTRDELVVSRLLGQLIGIAAAALVTQLFWPSWAHKNTRQLLAKSLRQSGKLLLTPHPEDSQPTLAIEAMLAESAALVADSDLFHEAPVQYFYRSLSADEKLEADRVHEMFNWCSELHFHIGPYLNNEIQPPQHDLHVAIADIAQHLSFKMLAHMKEEHGELETCRSMAVHQLQQAKQLQDAHLDVTPSELTRNLRTQQVPPQPAASEQQEMVSASGYHLLRQRVSGRTALGDWLYADHLMCKIYELLMQMSGAEDSKMTFVNSAEVL